MTDTVSWSAAVLNGLLPSDVTTTDIVAFVWFLGVWGAFNFVQDHLLTGGVNQHLIRVRRHWMERMMEREVRLPDTMLLGHSMQSCSFFASTTVLVLAGLVGSFGMADHAQQILAELSFTTRTTLEFFNAKLLMLGCIFIFAFFKFTWALRQFNYCVALIGSAPIPPVPEDIRKRIAERIAGMLSLALSEFNSGIRAYYFALAALNWLIDPRLFMLATAGVVGILSRRQLLSRPERLLREQLALLDDLEEINAGRRL
jgi:uncharacterized membrane protein